MNKNSAPCLFFLALSACGAATTTEGDAATSDDEAADGSDREDGETGSDGATASTTETDSSEADSAETSDSDSSETDSDSSETDGETGDVPDVEYAEGIEVIDLCVTLEASCALRPDSSIVCWGSRGDLSGEYAALSEDCGLALTQTGQVVDLTDAGVEYGFDQPPYVEIATSDPSAGVCSRRAEGTVDCWSMWGPEDGATPPAAGPATRIAAGGALACLVRATGEVACWNFHAIPFIDNLCELDPTPPPGAYKDVDVGCSNTFLVGEDGRVYRWRASEGTLTEESALGQANAKVRFGPDWGYNVNVLKDDGTILGYDGEPAVPGVYSALAVSEEHACAIRADNDHVVCWGKNDHGQSVPPTE